MLFGRFGNLYIALTARAKGGSKGMLGRKSFLKVAFLVCWIIMTASVASAAPKEKPETPALPSVQSAETGQGGQGEKAPKTRTLRLTLHQAIKTALKNNLDIKVEEKNPEIKEKEIASAHSIFEPLLSGSVGLTLQREPTGSTLAGAELLKQDNFFHQFELKKMFGLGTTAAISYDSTRLKSNSIFQTLNPSWTSHTSFSITQPLLRNFGRDVTESDLYIARINHQISLEQLRLQMIRTVADVERTYWSLVFAIKDLEAKQKSLQLAENLLHNTELRVKAGTLAPIEVTRAKATVAARKEDVIIAKNAVKDAEDLLRQAMNEPGVPLAEDVEVIPVDAPSEEVVMPDVSASVAAALANRPDYLQAKKEIETRDITLKVAKNQLLPALELQATYARNGLGEKFGSSLDDISQGSQFNWSAGFAFEVPLGNEKARSQYAIARIQKEQALISLKNFEHNITVQIKAAVRAVIRDLERIRSNAVTVQLARERLAAEEKKFDAGVSISLDVLDAQRVLTQAESNYQRALTDYNKSLVTLEEQKGTLLQKKKILIAE